jgi:hypothetical protein
MIRMERIKHQIFFLSKGPSLKDVGVLKEKISQLIVATFYKIFKLHLLLNVICNARPLNSGYRDIHYKVIET